MCSSATSTTDATLERRKLAKFVELLILDYLQSKGFNETKETFSAECLNCCARDGDRGSFEKQQDIESTKSVAFCDGSPVDEASSWYYVADKLALPELLLHNAGAPAEQRLTAVVEVLVQELAQERTTRSRAPSTVSITSVRDSKGRRKPVEHTAIPVKVPRSVKAPLSKSLDDLAAIGTPRDISAGTMPNGVCHESARTAPGANKSSSEINSVGRRCRSKIGRDASETKGHCKRSLFQGKIGESRNALCVRAEGRTDAPRKHHTASTSTAKRGHGRASAPKGNNVSSPGGMLHKFHFNKDAMRRQHMSHENWIPDDLRMKMMRRSMAVIKENVYESVAQDTLVRKEKKRSNRSELEIVKTQEKFGTKHQRPCALCEQSFSEVNLVLAVPFKAIVDLRIAWQKTLPQAKGSATKTNRTMLKPPQCYNEVKVCAFCSQLFHDPLGYRPTWDMEVTSMRRKQEQLALEKEREYWDPLRKVTQTNEQEHQQPLPADANQSGSAPALPEDA